MNGRLYDPRLGRMLQPDPILQAPGNSQNYNRYSYVFNNPLKYTDPSGYYSGPPKDVINSGYRSLRASNWAAFFSSKMGYEYGSSNNYGFINSGHSIRNDVIYDYHSGKYVNKWSRDVVSWETVNNNVVSQIVDYAVGNVHAWADYVGTTKNPYMYFTGFSFTGTLLPKNRMINNGSTGGGDLWMFAAMNSIAGFTLYEGAKTFADDVSNFSIRVLGKIPKASVLPLKIMKGIPYFGFAVGVAIDATQYYVNPNFGEAELLKSSLIAGVAFVPVVGLPFAIALYSMEVTGVLDKSQHTMMEINKIYTVNGINTAPWIGQPFK